MTGRWTSLLRSQTLGVSPHGPHFDASLSGPVPHLAGVSTLADHFYLHLAFGGALLNHMWLVCLVRHVTRKMPENLIAQVDAYGQMRRDGAITPDGYAVNTIEPRSAPYVPDVSDAGHRLPPQTMPWKGRSLH